MSPERLDELLSRALQTGLIPKDATPEEREELEPLLERAEDVRLNAVAVRAEADAALPAMREFAKALEPLIVPGKIQFAWRLGGDMLPQDGITDGLDAELGQRVDVAQPRKMPRLAQLVAYLVADPDAGTFHSAPKFEPSHAAAAAGSSCDPCACRRSSIRRKVASAWPTIWSIL